MNLIEIERFAIHDGPGIRTVVFLQGCPLRCPWCSNPESQRVGRHLMYDERKCVHCGRCVKNCPEGVISIKQGQLTFTRRDCTDCTRCIDGCPQDALSVSGMEMTTDEVMEVVRRDKDYYEASGGGVTFSGGEAMMQPDALLELLKACKAEGIHTAVETCGQVPRTTIERLLPWIDLFLFDVKHTDAAKLKQTVRGDWNIIRANLQRIAEADPQRVIVRVPCIPGFNLNDEFFDSLRQLQKQLRIRQVDLLPYHTLALDKYRRLGIAYTLTQPPTKAEDLLPYQQQGRQAGLSVRIE